MRRQSKPGLPVWWRCLSCGEHGVGDGDAERHTKATAHPTMTTARPPSDTPSNNGTGRTSTKGGTLPGR